MHVPEWLVGNSQSKTPHLRPARISGVLLTQIISCSRGRGSNLIGPAQPIKPLSLPAKISSQMPC